MAKIYYDKDQSESAQKKDNRYYWLWESGTRSCSEPKRRRLHGYRVNYRAPRPGEQPKKLVSKWPRRLTWPRRRI